MARYTQKVFFHIPAARPPVCGGAQGIYTVPKRKIHQVRVQMFQLLGHYVGGSQREIINPYTLSKDPVYNLKLLLL